MLFVLAAAAAVHLIGWASGPATAQEVTWEKAFSAVPSAANAAAIEQHLSSRPHRAGTPADYATALFVQQRLQADGFQTRVVPYDVEFTAPVKQSLAIVSPNPVQFDLLEGTPGHHTPQEIAAGPPFAGSSGDGDVTGPLYYVNYGTAADLAALDAMHVDLRGAIALLRSGGGASYEELRKRGVAGIIEFTDPANDGFGRGQTWPHGNYKNIDMAERAGAPGPSASPTPLPPGDTTLPGQAPLPGIAHNAWNSVPRPDIPELPVTQRTARALLAALGGPVAAPEWHPLFEIVTHVGGNVRVHLVVQMVRKIVRIWNVIGDIRGSEQPDSIVMIGSHRDAMAFGAIDPGSGTTVLIQDADGFHKLLQEGWRPKRTIEIASWDGHELGLYGSISYAYQFGPQLRATMQQYINTDQVTTGSPFLIRASPQLWAFLKQIADGVQGPSGTALGTGAGTTATNPLLQPPSSGSDQQTFAYQLGIPSSSNGFRGDFGAHHTAEDDIPGIAVYDPGYKEAVADAILTGIQAMRAASATVAPWRISDHAQNLIAALRLDAPVIKAGVDLTQLQSALKDYAAAAAALDAQLDAAEIAGDATMMEALSGKQHAAMAAFYVQAGLSNYRYYHSIDRAPLAFPEVVNAAGAAGQQAGVDRFVAAVRAATAALR
jgi:N-acetylated-alpha-linked acidic dipeptidase